ncbi:hypothetical protein HDE80_004474 [Rhodanobacter sp. A1T4]|nr:hypothetical protein [Rhodanobacter sp. A1T4]
MTESSSSVSARNYVSAWLATKHIQLGLKQLKLETTESPVFKLSAWYESPEFLVDISVWDRACCLDIQVMEKSSNQFVFSEAGACENTTGLLVRLNTFSNWLAARAAAA